MLPDEPQIVIVDDDNDDIQLLTDALRDAGFAREIKAYTDPSLFMEFFSVSFLEERANLIVLDWNMPVITGKDILQAISQKFPGHLSNIIVFSTSIRPKDEAEALGLGAKQYFRKPSNYEDMLEFARTAIKVSKD